MTEYATPHVDPGWGDLWSRRKVALLIGVNHTDTIKEWEQRGLVFAHLSARGNQPVWVFSATEVRVMRIARLVWEKLAGSISIAEALKDARAIATKDSS